MARVPFGQPFSPYHRFQVGPSRGCAPFVEDQAVEVVGQIGERELCLRPGNTDGADEEAIAVFLVREDILDAGADRGLYGVGARHLLGHQPALRLAAMDAAVEHVGLEPCLVLAAAIGAVCPDIAGCVGGVDHPPQLPSVAVGGRGHRCLADETKVPIDADMRLVAKHRRGDLRKRGPVGALADLAADLHGPARIDILLVRLVRLAAPDLLY